MESVIVLLPLRKHRPDSGYTEGRTLSRRAVLGGATWQRCQFHLARNAVHHASNVEIRKRIGRQLKAIRAADDLARAETALADLVASYRDSAPKLADWLEQNVPEALAVFTLPEHHRKRLRTSNPIERSVQQNLKRRTVKIGVFPSEDALLRRVSAVLVEIDGLVAGNLLRIHIANPGA